MLIILSSLKSFLHGQFHTKDLGMLKYFIDQKNISSLKSFLHGQFHTKDLGMLKYFLGVEVMRGKHRLFLSQRKYVLDLLSETGKLAAKPCQSPMAQSLHLTR